MRQAQRKKRQIVTELLPWAAHAACRTRKDFIKDCWQHKEGPSIDIKEVRKVFCFHWRLWLSSLTILSPRFCGKLSYNSEIFLTDTQVSDFKVFWKWMINHYNRISMGLSLKNYWRFWECMPSTRLIETLIHARKETYAMWDADSCRL
jgi:hypothetical protein